MDLGDFQCSRAGSARFYSHGRRPEADAFVAVRPLTGNEGLVDQIFTSSNPLISCYYLTFDADPNQHSLETDDTNNRAWAKFRLDRKGANASVTVLETFGYAGNTSNK